MIQPDPDCPKCGGTGLLSQEGEEAVCSCVVAGHEQKTEESAGIPPKFCGRSFESFRLNNKEQARVHGRIREYVESFGKPASGDEAAGAGDDSTSTLVREKNGLLLYGDVGTGKTHLAVAALRALLRAGYDGRYWNVNDLFRAIRGQFSKGEGDTELLDDLAECDVLLLDDLGTHRNTDFVLDRLYWIINKRYDGLRPIIATTNLSLPELFEEFDQRIASRLFEMCYPVGFSGGDYRLAALSRSRKRA